MGYATCRKCNGSGRFYDSKSGKTFDCRSCDGSGSNKSLWTTRCNRCRTEIVYKAGTSEPTHCRDCRNIELTKTCAQYGCNNTIKYKVGWSDVRDYCGSCHNKRQKGFTASTCPGTGAFGCGNVIWSPPGKRFTHCRDCSEKKRADSEAKKRTKPCKHCGSTITYYVGGKEYDYCRSCNENQYKTCDGSGCNNQVKYKKYWTNIPNFCPDCKKKHDNRPVKSGDIYRGDLVPSGWRNSILQRDSEFRNANGRMIFKGKGTNGADYRVTWNNNTGEVHWTDQGLPKGHRDKHRDPRK